MDGNKRTGGICWESKRNDLYTDCLSAFFLANEYLRAMGLPGLLDEGKIGEVYKDVKEIADRHINVAAGGLDVEGLANSIRSQDRNGKS